MVGIIPLEGLHFIREDDARQLEGIHAGCRRQKIEAGNVGRRAAVRQVGTITRYMRGRVARFPRWSD